MHTIICLQQTPLCLPDEQGCSLAGGPVHLQTRPPDRTLPFTPHSPSVFLHTLHPYCTHSPFLCASTGSQGQAVRKAGGLVCGAVLISTGIWRRKARYLTPQTPHPSLSSLPPCISGGCFHHTTCIARFLKDVPASCLFHGRLPASSHIFQPLSVPHLFTSLTTHLPQFIC